MSKPKKKVKVSVVEPGVCLAILRKLSKEDIAAGLKIVRKLSRKDLSRLMAASSAELEAAVFILLHLNEVRKAFDDLHAGRVTSLGEVLGKIKS